MSTLTPDAMLAMLKGMSSKSAGHERGTAASENHERAETGTLEMGIDSDSMSDGEDRPMAASLLDRLMAEPPSSLAKGSASAKVVTPATPTGSLPPNRLLRSRRLAPPAVLRLGPPLLRRSSAARGRWERAQKLRKRRLLTSVTMGASAGWLTVRRRSSKP